MPPHDPVAMQEMAVLHADGLSNRAIGRMFGVTHQAVSKTLQRHSNPGICCRGHQWTPETTKITANGSRYCLECQATRSPKAFCKRGHALTADNRRRRDGACIICYLAGKRAAKKAGGVVDLVKATALLAVWADGGVLDDMAQMEGVHRNRLVAWMRAVPGYEAVRAALNTRPPRVAIDTRWAEKTEAKFRAMWAEGKSAAEIGLEVGVSRSAVCGKRRRLKLPQRTNPVRRREPDAPVARRARERLPPRAPPAITERHDAPRPVAAPPVRPAPPVPLPAPYVVASPAGTDTCSWPLNDARPWRYCGAPVCCRSREQPDGSVVRVPGVYCTLHQAVSVGRRAA